MKLSFIEILFILLLVAVITNLYLLSKFSECHDKGGAFIEGQCIDVKIIK